MAKLPKMKDIEDAVFNDTKENRKKLKKLEEEQGWKVPTKKQMKNVK